MAGKLTIDANLCYGDKGCDANNNSAVGNSAYGGISYQRSNKLGIYSTSYGSISQIPQILIFADAIDITENVTQIDAWLIVSGEINTCSTLQKNSRGEKSDANACNKTLLFNGPVFAQTLRLNRTAGALQASGGGAGYSINFVPSTTADDALPADPSTHNLANDGAIIPAEIFHLRSDAYYWAYSQAQRYAQAVTTYTRELAPRY